MDPRNQKDTVENLKNLSREPAVQYDTSCVNPRTLAGNTMPKWALKDFPLVRQITIGGCPVGVNVGESAVLAHAHPNRGSVYQNMCFPCGSNSSLAWDDNAPTATFLHEYAHLLCADFQNNPEHAKEYPALKNIDTCTSHDEAWAMVYKDVLLKKYYPEYDGGVYPWTSTVADWRLAQPALIKPKPLPARWQKMTREEQDAWTEKARPVIHKELTRANYPLELPKVPKRIDKLQGDSREAAMRQHIDKEGYLSQWRRYGDIAQAAAIAQADALQRIALTHAKEKPAKSATTKVKEKPAKSATTKVKEKPAKPATSTIKEKPAKPATSAIKEKPAKPATSTIKEKPAKPATSTIKEKPAKSATSTIKEKPAKSVTTKVKEKPAKSVTTKTKARTAQSVSMPSSKSLRRRKSATPDNPGKAENLTVRVGGQK